MNEKYLLDDIDPAILNAICGDIDQYSTTLVGLNTKDGNSTASLLGSGTFIQVGDMYGVLTAHHVTRSNQFRQSESVMLVIRNDNHYFHVRKDFMNVVDVGIPKRERDGPDLSVIPLGGSALATIKSTKSFWALDKFESVALNKDYPSNLGVYCVFGTPSEFCTDEPPADGYVATKSFTSFAYFSEIEKEWKIDGYDYLRFGVSYYTGDDSPKSFGGVSGAGLWHIGLAKDEDGSIGYSRPLLWGTAYYQTARLNDERALLCHGPESLYKQVVRALRPD